jgi:hypothetical protein
MSRVLITQVQFLCGYLPGHTFLTAHSLTVTVRYRREDDQDAETDRGAPQ